MECDAGRISQENGTAWEKFERVITEGNGERCYETWRTQEFQRRHKTS